MKKFLSFVLIPILLIILITNTSYARFVDMEYPPNSSGNADLTDEEAEDEYSNELEQQNTSAEDFIDKSSNNYLKSLTVENATLSPEFARQNERYTVTLNDPNAKTLKISAEAEDEKTTIEGTGEIELTDGINNLRVTVTAENGNVRFYNLTVELPYDQSQLRLNSLEIEGIVENSNNEKISLKPSFDKETFEYTMEVSNRVTGLQIDAKAHDNISVRISGGNSLDVGENTVIIELSNMNDETQKTTYTIKVTRNEDNSNNTILIVSIIAVVVILIIIIFMIKRKK